MDVLDFFQDFVRRITFSVPTYHSPITLCRPVPMGPTEWYPLSLCIPSSSRNAPRCVADDANFAVLIFRFGVWFQTLIGEFAAATRRS